MALAHELNLSHPIVVASTLVGGFVLFLLHPQEAGTIAATAPPYTIGAATPTAAAPAPAPVKSLP
jgi:hypothetical protein